MHRQALLALAAPVLGLALMAAGHRHRPAPPPPPPSEVGDVVIHGPAKVAAEVVQVERAFAARSMEAGTATAFAEFMDSADSRAFTGGDPVRGAEAIGASHAGPGVLNWQPKEVFVSKGGDMAFVWGQFRFDLPKGAQVKGHTAITGRYVTTWRRDAKAGWKAIIDIGTPDQG